jgi:DNA repair exonuclease SbcCD ATPase subunit
MEIAKQIKARLKKIEDLRKELKAPYKKAGDDIDAYAKAISEILTEPSNHLNAQFLNWNRELEKIRQAEAERIRKEEAARQAAADKAAKEAMDLVAFEKEIGNDEAAQAQELTVIAEYERTEAKAIDDVRAELKKVEDIRVKGVTLRWDFTIFDKSLIPLEYMVPNETLIRKAIVDSKGAVNIPGVESFQKESMTIR